MRLHDMTPRLDTTLRWAVTLTLTFAACGGKTSSQQQPTAGTGGGAGTSGSAGA